MKLPSFQFYPGDWKKDPNLARATKAEKGFLMDLLCLMFECDERGVVASLGVPWSDQEISGAIQGEPTENLLCLHELLRKGVIHRNSAGAIFSRRMVRDEEIRKMRVESGKEGGRPSLSRKQNESKTKAKRKQNITPSVSSSSSSSNKSPPITPLKGDGFDFLWKQYPRPQGRKAALRHFQAACKQYPDAADRISKALENYKAHIIRERIEQKFVQHGSTWFNNWEDWLNQSAPLKKQEIVYGNPNQEKREAAERKKVLAEEKEHLEILEKIRALPERERKEIEAEAERRIPVGLPGVGDLIRNIKQAEVFLETYK